MSKEPLKYSINKSTVQEIIGHLRECKNNFKPTLSSRVKIEEYSTKIYEKAVRFEAWHDGKLIGLIASYFNDMKSKKGFITSVSVDRCYQGKGIAKTLLVSCLKYANDNLFIEIELEVSKYCKEAVNLYSKSGFRKFSECDNSIFMIYKPNNL